MFFLRKLLEDQKERKDMKETGKKKRHEAQENDMTLERDKGNS